MGHFPLDVDCFDSIVMHATGEVAFNFRLVVNPPVKKDGLAQVQTQDFSELKPEAWVMKNADELDEEIERNCYNLSVRLTVEYAFCFMLFFIFFF